MCILKFIAGENNFPHRERQMMTQEDLPPCSKPPQSDLLRLQLTSYTDTKKHIFGCALMKPYPAWMHMHMSDSLKSKKKMYQKWTEWLTPPLAFFASAVSFPDSAWFSRDDPSTPGPLKTPATRHLSSNRLQLHFKTSILASSLIKLTLRWCHVVAVWLFSQFAFKSYIMIYFTTHITGKYSTYSYVLMFLAKGWGWCFQN